MIEPMTTATRTAWRPRWVLVFLAAVLAVLVAAFGAAPASAATAPGAQNAVGVSTSAGQVAVGPSVGIGAGQRLGNDPPRAQIVVATGVATEDGGGLLSGLKGRLNAARLAGNDSGAISLGGHEFSDDEIAQLTYKHIGEGDIPGRPSLDEISAALKNAQGVPLEGQNALQYEYGGVRVIVNGDAPWRSTAYYPGK